MAVKKRLAIAACILALACAVACKHQSTTQELLPASGDVAGWSRSSAARNFAADDLYKYIDGDAERFLKAGVEKVETADYKYLGKLEATADVYTMSGADGALKILASEPAGSAKAADIGEASRIDAQSLVFRKGRHFVRIVAFQDTPETQTAVLQLGREIARRLID